MNKFARHFSAGSGFAEFSARMRHLFVVNVLWIVCSIPVVTFGAASAAACESLQFTREAEHVKSGKLYFAALRKHFKRASVLWLELAAMGMVIGACLFLLIRSGNRNPAVLAAAAFVAFLYAVILPYAFPVLIRSDGSALEVVAFSLLCGLRCLPWTLLAAVLSALPVVMFFFETYWFVLTSILWLFYGFAFLAYVNLLILNRVFRRLPRETVFLHPAPDSIPKEAESGI